MTAAPNPVPPAPAAPSGPGSEIDLGQILGTLWKGKLWIGLGMALGLAVGAFVVANTAPTYQSDALLQLEDRSGTMALPSSLAAMVDTTPRSVTEMEILRSRMVLGQAVADLNLDWRVTPDLVPVIGTLVSRYPLPLVGRLIPARYARPGDLLRLEQLLVPPDWVNRNIVVTVRDARRFRVRLPDGSVQDGEVGVPVRVEGRDFVLTLSGVEAAPGRRFTLQQIDEIRAIAGLRSRLAITERGRMSNVLEVRLTGESRSDNSRALNAVVQSYLRQNVTRSAAEAEGSLAFIRDQLPQAEQRLRAAEAALNAFRQQQMTIDLSLETQTLLGQVNRTEAELSELQRREDEVAQRYTPSHPTYRQLLDERERLQQRLATLREQVGTLPETQRQVLNLTREVELAQRIYTELLTRAQEVEVLRASSIGNVRIIDSAAAGSAPIAPQSMVILAMALVLGAAAGVVLVLVLSWLRKGVQDAGELERMGLPVLATVNYSREADTAGRRDGALPILAITQPTDLTVEAFRSLRTSLHFGMLDAETPTLTITSSHPGAGKSFLATNLAVVTAQAGNRVCLIDADLRRGQLRRYFDLPRNQPGLAEVLAGDRRIEDVLMPGPVDGLHVLTTGRYPPNPSELLMRAELSDLVAWCAEHFDLTLFDAPPTLAVTDPVILGRATGASVVIARHDMTLPGEVEAVIKSFAAAGLRLSGAILNGFDPRKAKAGYGYGYGYGYRYEYKQRQD